MKLTKKDKDFLLSIGNRPQDLAQIEEAIPCTIFECNGKRITQRGAQAMLGREEFLCGMSRSAFHWSTSRETKKGKTIRFDSSPYFGHHYDHSYIAISYVC